MSDYSIQTIELPVGNSVDVYANTSNRISQTLYVLDYIQKNIDKHSSIEAALSNGLAFVSRKLGITRQTVTDKMGRQMGMKIKDYSPLLDEWLNKKNPDRLKDMFLKHIGKGFEDEDTYAINAFFDKDKFDKPNIN